MLFPQRLERLKQALLEEKVNLEKEVANLTATAQESNVGLGNHMADDATAVFDQATAVSLRRGHERALDEVNAALERMEAGTYGMCDRGGEAIDFARLKAVPQATLCMSCQTIVEFSD
jgi:RNA polymerase-binding protein DksA